MSISELNKYEKLCDIFFHLYVQDTSKFLIPRMPYYDRFAFKRVMDYAIISQDPSMPRVAILIRAKTSNHLKQIELEKSLCVIRQLDWFPLVLAPEDIEARPDFVRHQIEDIFTQTKPSPKQKAAYRWNIHKLLSWIALVFGKRVSNPA